MHWSIQKIRHISRNPCHISYVAKRTELHALPGDERGRGGGGGQSSVQHNHTWCEGRKRCWIWEGVSLRSSLSLCDVVEREGEGEAERFMCGGGELVWRR